MICFELTTETPEEMITLLRGLNLEGTKNEPVYKVQKPTILRPEDVQTEEGLGEAPKKDAFQQGDEVKCDTYDQIGVVFGKNPDSNYYAVLFKDRMAMVPENWLQKTGRRINMSHIGTDSIGHGGTECES